ncbi:peptidase s53 [Lasius niger]|uniref:Peptidase s53 n=1 Tax=Lasius niger TaxID=67767 RepID=A0A0J7K3G7_LASNI|nr:peptidase s53 [Lasius niger]
MIFKEFLVPRIDLWLSWQRCKHAIYGLPWLLSASAFAATSLPAGWVATQTSAQIPPGVAAAALPPDLAAAMAAAKPIADNDPRLIAITVSLSLRDPAGLNQAAAEAGRSGHFLSPEEIRDRFAPTAEQALAVADYLRRCGLQKVEIASNRMLVTAQGSAAAIRRAFHTSLSAFTYHGRSVYANTAPALVPQALGGSVGRVLGLENLNQVHVGPVPQPLPQP